MEWRIYYADGSIFDSSQGTPEAAPATGFICALGYDESGDRYMMQSWDHYCWDRDAKQWWGMDLCGVFDRLRRNKVFAYKEGRTVTKAEFGAIVSRANADPDFPMRR